MNYNDFINAKTVSVKPSGFRTSTRNPDLWDWQRSVVDWACSLGRCALFADTGLGKTRMQLQWAAEVVRHTGSRVIILAPLAVGAQTVREAIAANIDGVELDRNGTGNAPITVSNYERLARFNPADFAGVVLDESSILKNYTGKTKQMLIDAFGATPYRLACTATPAPNDHLELGNHSQFLGIMDSHKMIARWFITDQREAGSYRLKGHAVRPFWDWVASWARCIGVPSDIGPYSDEGFNLPKLTTHRHVARVDLIEGRGENLFRMPQMSATSIHKEKRRTATDRARMVADIVAAEPDEDWVVWTETNYDADALRLVLPEANEVRGNMKPDEKSDRLLRFSDEGGIMLTKPGIAGMGLNWQHCARVVFNGLSFSYERYYQAVRRCWRFGQTRPVDCHVVMAETELSIWSIIDRKSNDHDVMKRAMFAASRRAASRLMQSDPYTPTHSAALPAWLHTKETT